MRQYNLFDNSFIEYEEPNKVTSILVGIQSKEDLIYHIAEQIHTLWCNDLSADATNFDEWFDHTTRSLCKKDSETYRDVKKELRNFIY